MRAFCNLLTIFMSDICIEYYNTTCGYPALGLYNITILTMQIYI